MPRRHRGSHDETLERMTNVGTEHVPAPAVNGGVRGHFGSGADRSYPRSKPRRK